MMDILLQFSGGLSSTIALVLNVLTTLLGLGVAYIAFRGYRRNQSRPMAFIAVGFVLTFWTPVLLLVSFLILPEVARIAPDALGLVDFLFGVAGSVSQLIGLLCILYGLRMPLRR
jgi:hypothetical protein